MAFPVTLDSFTNPLSSDFLNSPSHAGQHANANNAIAAIEAKLGIDGSAVTTSVDYLLRHLPRQESAIEHAQVSTPSSPSSGYNKLYFKSDGNLYKLSSVGVESRVGGSTDGWEPAGETPTYSSIDTATGVMTVASGAKTKYPIGSRLRWEQSQSLTAYWSFDTNSNDAINSHNGTDTSMTYTAGKFSNAATFNGTTSKIQVTDHANLKPTGAFTVGMWVKSNVTATRKELFASYSANTNIAGLDIFIDTTNVIAVVTGNNTGTVGDQHWTSVLGVTNVCDNQWHYVVVAYQNNFLQIYVDGKREVGEYAIAPAYAATNYVRIGCNSATGTDVNFMNGQIDDLFLINGYALDEETVKDKYDAQTAQGSSALTVTKYGLLHAVTDTTLAIFTGTDYALVNSAISNFYYSIVKAPIRFPLKQHKWSLESWNATLTTQATPNQNQWYNLGSLQLVVPIGSWSLEYFVSAQINDATSGSYGIETTISSANNTESDEDFTCGGTVAFPATSGASLFFSKRKDIDMYTKQTRYLNTRSVTAGADNLYNRGDQMRNIIRVVSAFI